MESNDFVSFPAAINATLSGAGSQQIIVPLNGAKTVGLAETYTGTLAGTVAIWTSGDYRDPGNGDATQIAAAEARATWNVVTTALTNPAGAAGEKVDTITVAAVALRARITWSSGSGNYLLNITKLFR